MVIAAAGFPVLLNVTSAEDLQQRPVFRAGTDVIVVHVTVLQKGTPQPGLIARDFELLDNGVHQEVELISQQRVPLDVSLVVDAGWRVTDEVRGTTIDEKRFTESIRDVANLLRPPDRLGLVRFRSDIREDLPLSTVPVEVHAEPIPAYWSALDDAVVQAMLRPSPPGRRHIIVVFTDGLDVGSVLTPLDVTSLVARCDAAVYVVLDRHRGARGMLSSSGNPVVVQMLRDVARETGGEVLSESDVPAALKKVLSSAEHGYVLTYVPQGATKAGWHEIKVTVTRPGSFDVRARRGYVWK